MTELVNCRLCIVGGSINDVTRIQLINPEEVDLLYLLFSNRGFNLSVDCIDPGHSNNIHERVYSEEYKKKKVKLHSKLFNDYLVENPILEEFLIVVDFTGLYTPHEIETNYNIKKSIEKVHSKLAYNSRVLLLPMGCACESFNYSEFLNPLIEYQCFVNLNVSEGSLFTICNTLISRVDSEVALYEETLGIDPYNIKIDVLKPYLEMIISGCEISLDYKEVLSYFNKIKTSYSEDNTNSIRIFNLHKQYIDRIISAIKTEINLLFSILQGLYTYKELKPWFLDNLPSLKEENTTLIPFYIYSILHLLCTETTLFNGNSIEDMLKVFTEKNRLYWLQTHCTFYKSL